MFFVHCPRLWLPTATDKNGHKLAWVSYREKRKKYGYIFRGDCNGYLGYLWIREGAIDIAAAATAVGLWVWVKREGKTNSNTEMLENA